MKLKIVLLHIHLILKFYNTTSLMLTLSVPTRTFLCVARKGGFLCTTLNILANESDRGYVLICFYLNLCLWKQKSIIGLFWPTIFFAILKFHILGYSRSSDKIGCIKGSNIIINNFCKWWLTQFREVKK